MIELRQSGRSPEALAKEFEPSAPTPVAPPSPPRTSGGADGAEGVGARGRRGGGQRDGGGAAGTGVERRFEQPLN